MTGNTHEHTRYAMAIYAPAPFSSNLFAISQDNISSSRTASQLSLRSTASTSSFASAQSSTTASLTTSSPFFSQSPFHTTEAPLSLNALLAAPMTQRETLHSRCGSVSSMNSRGPSCFSREDAEMEKEMYGDRKMKILEPREDLIGWWGVGEVLSMDCL